jgi:hypothetical protein
MGEVKIPTLVLHCRDELQVPFEEGRLLAAKIPGARFVPLEGRNRNCEPPNNTNEHEMWFELFGVF